MNLTLGSLFDGISGFPLAASWSGIETKWLSEIDPYCLKVSKKNFPNVIQYGNIKEIGKGRKWEPEAVNIISGGFPCQPYSLAGKRKGKEDDRHLWPEMLRIIREVRPRWVVGENVYGIINWNRGLVFDEVQTDLEAEGYEVFAYVLPAVSINAPHRRDRVWFVAYSIGSDRGGNEGERKKENKAIRSNILLHPAGLSNKRSFTNSNFQRLQEWIQGGFRGIQSQAGTSKRGEFTRTYPKENWREFPTQSPVCRRDDGIPHRVDRIKALGNAIVPQVVHEIFKVIVTIENETTLDY
jgi:DNA (cytosine-5)-methyltransferase 1